jgi:hypothetical protein
VSEPTAGHDRRVPSTPRITQITHGPLHHVFGYIGHCQTIPWSGDGRYVLCLELGFQDRMPGLADEAGITLLDTQRGHAVERVTATRAWNPQQGSMLYWDPEAPTERFFHNDLDPSTGAAFTVLYDVRQRRRVREFRSPGIAVANGGVAQGGGAFLAINYGRLARLRPVTGYPAASDPTVGHGAPDDDGIVHVDTSTGRQRLICSYERMRLALVAAGRIAADAEVQLFVNHTLWNRSGDLVMFFVRSGAAWRVGGGAYVNETCTMRPDGSELTCHGYVGGHPEWDEQSRIFAAAADGVVLYDPCRRAVVGTVAGRDVLTDPKGDKALSPDGRWLVHGDDVRTEGAHWHRYVFLHLSNGRHVSSSLLSRGTWIDGDLRLDPAPCWNRTSDRVLVPAIAEDGTRQLFMIECPDV